MGRCCFVRRPSPTRRRKSPFPSRARCRWTPARVTRRSPCSSGGSESSASRRRACTSRRTPAGAPRRVCRSRTLFRAISRSKPSGRTPASRTTATTARRAPRARIRSVSARFITWSTASPSTRGSLPALATARRASPTRPTRSTTPASTSSAGRWAWTTTRRSTSASARSPISRTAATSRASPRAPIGRLAMPARCARSRRACAWSSASYRRELQAARNETARVERAVCISPEAAKPPVGGGRLLSRSRCPAPCAARSTWARSRRRAALSSSRPATDRPASAALAG